MRHRHIAAWVALLFAGPAYSQTDFDERYFQQPAGAVPVDPSSAPALSRQIGQESRRFVDEANYELAGSPQGQQVMTRGLAMIQASDQVEQTGRFGPQSPQFQRALGGLEASVGGVRSAMGGVPFAQATARTLRRVERLTSDLRRASQGDGGGYYPPTPPTSFDRVRFRAAAMETAGDINQAAGSLYDEGWAQYSPYDQISRELNAMAYDLQNLAGLVDRQAPDDQVRNALRAPQSRANQVINLVRGAPPQMQPPASFTGYWNRAQRGINRLAMISSGGADPGPGPLPPIQPPIQPPIRPPIQPPIGGGPIQIIDQMNAELDQFLGQLQATVLSVPQGFEFQRDARSLQASLGQLRNALSGGGSGGPGALQDVNNRYQRLWDRMARVSKGRPGPNVDRVRRMGDLLNQLTAQLPG